MSYEIIELNDLSDSRELMIKKSPHADTILLSIVYAMLIIALVWASFGKLDTFIKATGEVRPTENAPIITLMNGGKVEKINYKDGQTVKKGDVILTLDYKYYNEQKDGLLKQIDQKKLDLEKYDILKDSIEKDVNSFDVEKDPQFYYQYENYRIDLESTINQVSKGNKQITANQNEIEKTILQNQDMLNQANSSYNEYLKLYDDINSDRAYTGTDKTMKSIYDTYRLSLQKAKDTYNKYKSSYDELTKLSQTNPNTVTQEQINQAEYLMNTANNDVLSTKTNVLSQINNTMQELDSQKKSYQSNIDVYNIKKDALELDNTLTTSKQKLKNSYYLEIENSVLALTKEIESLQSQVKEIEQTISQLTVTAPQGGNISFVKNISVGDTISAGTPIASITPSSDEYNVVLYIPEKYISSIKTGQKIEYRFSAISPTDFGKVYGKILSVTTDSFADEKSGEKYYKSIASIDKTQLKNKYGEIADIKVGMVVEAKAVTGTQSVLSWLMEKISFI